MGARARGKKEITALSFWEKCGYFLEYSAICIFTVAFGIEVFPELWKSVAVDFFASGIHWISAWLSDLSSASAGFALVLICGFIIVVGVCKGPHLIYFWFKSTEKFEFPLAKYFHKGPIPNVFYDPFIKDKGKGIAKEAARLRKELDRRNEANDKLIKQVGNYTEQLKEQANKTNEFQIETWRSLSILKDLERLMEHIMVLIAGPLSDRKEDKFLREVVSAVARLPYAQGIQTKEKVSCSVMKVEEDVLKIVECVGLKSGSEKKTFRLGQGFAGRIWESREPDVCNDVNDDVRFNDEGCKPSGVYKSIIGIPILGVGGEALGALFVQCSCTNAFDLSKDGAMLAYYSGLLSLAFAYTSLQSAGESNKEASSF